MPPVLRSGAKLDVKEAVGEWLFNTGDKYSPSGNQHLDQEWSSNGSRHANLSEYDAHDS